MTHHLSTLQIKQLCVSASPEDELVAAGVHTAECQSCDQRFVEELRRQRGSVPSNFSLEPEFWFRHDHVDFDLLVELADKTLDEETEEIVNIHLRTCETCREDVRSFLAFRETTAGEMNVSYGPIYYKRDVDIPAAPPWQRLRKRPVYVAAAIVLMTVAVLIGVIALTRRSGVLEANKQGQLNPRTEGSASSSPIPNVNSSPSTAENPTKVAILRDANGELTLDNDGRITGLDQVSENSRQYIAQAFSSGRIESPDVLRHLAGEPGRLRGNDDGPKGFSLLYPQRGVLTEDRPVFRWESLPGASSYRVYVLDADGNQVRQSEELPATQTQWKTMVPLRRGRIFSWVVTALVDGQKVVSPSASAPEMKFAVLSAADLKELTRLRKSNSHLALGVFYARVGLLDQAEREFQSLIKLNPDSELARKLLQNVRSVRQGS